jgi:hypothetical protein
MPVSGEDGDDVDTFGIEHVALAPAGLVADRQGIENAAPVDAGGSEPKRGGFPANGA